MTTLRNNFYSNPSNQTATAISRMPSSSVNWQCSVSGDNCCNRLAGTIGEDNICIGCIRDLFAHAIDQETSFPPRWGAVELSLVDYAHLLPEAFCDKYWEKVHEYRTPAAERVHCKKIICATEPVQREVCGGLVGRRFYPGSCKACIACNAYTCLRCEELLPPGLPNSAVRIDHRYCLPRETHEADPNFRGLELGVHYQICPSKECKRRVELEDGCNHVRCVCGTDFCFLCGERATHYSGHWKQGNRCPRYNRPGAANAAYDDSDLDENDGPHAHLDNDDDDQVDFQLQEVLYEQAIADKMHARQVHNGARNRQEPAWQVNDQSIHARPAHPRPRAEQALDRHASANTAHVTEVHTPPRPQRAAIGVAGIHNNPARRVEPQHRVGPPLTAVQRNAIDIHREVEYDLYGDDDTDDTNDQVEYRRHVRPRARRRRRERNHPRPACTIL